MTPVMVLVSKILLMMIVILIIGGLIYEWTVRILDSRRARAIKKWEAERHDPSPKEQRKK
ncbi:MAG: hypothetical protein COB09_18750 [Thalassobium sp.]|nr:MAG: hypothetical protein COB09_18750 [Thalassobium sp.]